MRHAKREPSTPLKDPTVDRWNVRQDLQKIASVMGTLCESYFAVCESIVTDESANSALMIFDHATRRNGKTCGLA
jgi:hypothetical protein